MAEVTKADEAQDTNQQQETSQAGQQAAQESKSAYTPPASQEELDRIIAARLKREQEKYKDYDSLKAAADELKKLKEADMSELERATARVQELEARVAELQGQIEESNRAAERAGWVAEIASSTGVPEKVLLKSSATTREELEELAAEFAPHFKTPGAAPAQKQGVGGESAGNTGDLTPAEIVSAARAK